MSFKTARLHVMSGTGNSYLLANALADRLRDEGTEVEMHRAVDGVPQSAFRTGKNHLVALFGPTHAFTAPLPLIRLACRLPRGQGTAAAVFLSRGGLMFGRRATPGLEGTATWLLAFILWLKGYSVRVLRAFDMPENWTTVHSSMKERKCRKIIGRAMPRLNESADVLLAGRRRYWGLIPLLLGLILLPISILYLIVGRFVLAKMYFSDHRCTGCGKCAKTCPHDGIDMYGPGRRRPYWTLRCQNCMRCMSYCPEQCIQAGYSWAVLMNYLMMIPVVMFAIGYVRPKLAESLGGDPVLAYVVSYGNAILMIVLSYFAFFWLTRIRFIARLFAWTTLTTIFRRYRAPGVSAGDLIELAPVDWDAVVGIEATEDAEEDVIDDETAEPKGDS